MYDPGSYMHGALVRNMTVAMNEAAAVTMRQFGEGRNEPGPYALRYVAPIGLPPRKEMVEIMERVLKEIQTFPVGYFIPDDYRPTKPNTGR